MGHDQKEPLMDIINRCGHYDNVVFYQDYSGYDRIASMRKRSISQ
jgi:hypothetical protein